MFGNERWVFCNIYVVKYFFSFPELFCAVEMQIIASVPPAPPPQSVDTVLCFRSPTVFPIQIDSSNLSHIEHNRPVGGLFAP